MDSVSERLETLDSILQKAGYARLFASELAEAIIITRRESPDLIIAYSSLSGENPNEAIRLIKSVGEFETIPVLLLGETPEDEINAEIADDAFDYLKIPFEPLKLATTIASLIERERMRKVVRKKDFRFRTIIENSTDLISVLSPDGIILYESPSVKQMIGREPMTNQNVNAFDFIHPHDRRWVAAHLRKAIPNPTSANSIEYRYRHQDGSWVFLDSVGRLVEDPTKGKVIVVSSRDVTKRKQVERSLQESEKKFRAQYNSFPIPTYTWKKQGDDFVFSDFNDAAITVTQGKIKTLLGMKLSALYEDVPEVISKINLCFDEKVVTNDELYYKFRTTGKWHLLDINYVFVPPDLVMLHTRDITEKRQSAKLLEESENRFRLIAQATNDALWDWNLVEQTIWVSDSFYEMFGYAAGEDARYSNWSDLLYPADKDWVTESIYETINGQENYWTEEYRFRRKDGAYATVLDRGYIIRNESGEPVRMIGAMLDITGRRQTENTLRFQAHLLDTVEQAIIATDLDGAITYWNKFAEKIYGWTSNEAINQNVTDLLVSDPSILRSDELLSELLGGKSRMTETMFKRKSKPPILTETISSPIYGEQDKIIGFVGISIDITERRRAEENLLSLNAQIENQRQRLNTIISNISGVVWESRIEPDESRQYIDFVSDYVEVIFGYTAEEWISQPSFWLRVIHPEDRERVRSETRFLIETGRENAQRYRCIAKDGRIVWIETRMVLIKDEFGHPQSLRGISIDITESKLTEEALRRSEEQLRQSQKLESVGRLAGGIAHDFNNMLTAINGYSDLILRHLGDTDDPIAKMASEIRKAGERSAALTHQLLAFSRRQVLQPKMIDINHVVNEMSELLRRLIGEDVQLTISLHPESCCVEADPGQLAQVIMNLVVNARDAMPDGGEVNIQTANVLIENEPVSEFARGKIGEFIVLSVTDDGIGIEGKDLEKIFEPFYTTKDVGIGTGLGLSTVYGIVKQSGGYIWVDSEPGNGATFNIYLPFVPKETVAEEKEAKSSTQFPGGAETILLVEDEEAVRNLTYRILELCGYTVIEARNGREALKICEKNDCKIDLLITDIVMPQMNGRELAEEISRLNPNIRILFTSGYTSDRTMRHGISEDGINFIQKPFAPDTLARKVRALLDGTRD